LLLNNENGRWQIKTRTPIVNDVIENACEQSNGCFFCCQLIWDLSPFEYFKRTITVRPGQTDSGILDARIDRKDHLLCLVELWFVHHSCFDCPR
jgi:hypothetical protein